MVYALDAATGKIKWEREALKAQAVRRPPSQEHLRVGNAVHRRRAALRVVRPERRARPSTRSTARCCGRSSGRRSRSISTSARRRRRRCTTGASISCTTAKRTPTSRRSTPRPATSCGAPRGPRTGLPKSSWTTPFVWVNEKRTEIVTLGHGDGPVVRPRRQGAVARDRHVDADGVAARRRTAGSTSAAARRATPTVRSSRSSPAPPATSRSTDGDDEQRLHRVPHPARLRLHAVGARPRRHARISCTTPASSRSSTPRTGERDLQGPGRRRRAHVLGVAGGGRATASTS